MTKMTAHL